MATLLLVIKKALEKDTPQSCAVVTGGLVGIDAVIGHATTKNPIDILIGAAAGWVSLISTFVPSNGMTLKGESSAKQFVPKTSKSYAQSGNQSGYLVN
ncbi:hypothetical protein [Fodinibius sp. SL11]|uniref:hypothetical protein n=1 Tax=Fodinibius sp. SL11 TaxID=3425690 RepID=UPI003F882E13